MDSIDCENLQGESFISRLRIKFWSMKCFGISAARFSGEAIPTFDDANANFPVFIDLIRNQFLKKE